MSLLQSSAIQVLAHKNCATFTVASNYPKTKEPKYSLTFLSKIVFCGKFWLYTKFQFTGIIMDWNNEIKEFFLSCLIITAFDSSFSHSLYQISFLFPLKIQCKNANYVYVINKYCTTHLFIMLQTTYLNHSGRNTAFWLKNYSFMSISTSKSNQVTSGAHQGLLVASKSWLDILYKQ